MFQRHMPVTMAGRAFSILQLIFHATVRHVRKSDRSPIVGLLMSITQAVMMVAIFYLMFDILGLRGAAIRGDFILYIMSGVFLFMTHNKALGAVLGAEGPTSAMMLHAPMNTVVAITGAALASLYQQLLAFGVILFVTHTMIRPIVIDDPVGMMRFFFIAWFCGAAIGTVLLALKPWLPRFVSIVSQLYRRANMIFSGKMFVANTLPGYMLPMFLWNPLFHTIDQARGAIFINYQPRVTNPDYALWFALVFITLGLMGEFFTRRHASASWDAAR